MSSINFVTFEVPEAWGPGARTPTEAADLVLRQIRENALRCGFWTLVMLPRPPRDDRLDRVAACLIAEDGGNSVGRTVTIELRVNAETPDAAISHAYAQLHDAARGPWEFVVKYSGPSHAVAIAVITGAPDVNIAPQAPGRAAFAGA